MIDLEYFKGRKLLFDCKKCANFQPIKDIVACKNTDYEIPIHLGEERCMVNCSKCKRKSYRDVASLTVREICINFEEEIKDE